MESMIENEMLAFREQCVSTFTRLSKDELPLELREEYPCIMFEMVSPFDGLTDKWQPEYQARAMLGCLSRPIW